MWSSTRGVVSLPRTRLSICRIAGWKSVKKADLTDDAGPSRTPRRHLPRITGQGDICGEGEDRIQIDSYGN